MKRGEKRKQYKRAQSQKLISLPPPFPPFPVFFPRDKIIRVFLQWLYLFFFCLFRRKGGRERGEILIQMTIWTFKKKDEERYTQKRGYSSVVEHLTAEKVCACVCTHTHIKLLMLASLTLPQRMFRETVFKIHFCTVFLGMTGIFYICNLQNPIRLKE